MKKTTLVFLCGFAVGLLIMFMDGWHEWSWTGGFIMAHLIATMFLIFIREDKDIEEAVVNFLIPFTIIGIVGLVGFLVPESTAFSYGKQFIGFVAFAYGFGKTILDTIKAFASETYESANTVQTFAIGVLDWISGLEKRTDIVSMQPGDKIEMVLNPSRWYKQYPSVFKAAIYLTILWPLMAIVGTIVQTVRSIGQSPDVVAILLKGPSLEVVVPSSITLGLQLLPFMYLIVITLVWFMGDWKRLRFRVVVSTFMIWVTHANFLKGVPHSSGPTKQIIEVKVLSPDELVGKENPTFLGGLWDNLLLRLFGGVQSILLPVQQRGGSDTLLALSHATNVAKTIESIAEYGRKETGRKESYRKKLWEAEIAAETGDDSAYDVHATIQQAFDRMFPTTLPIDLWRVIDPGIYKFGGTDRSQNQTPPTFVMPPTPAVQTGFQIIQPGTSHPDIPARTGLDLFEE